MKTSDPGTLDCVHAAGEESFMQGLPIVAGILADDLTGALEMGAFCASRGMRSAVTIGCSVPEPAVEALVIDTETRNESSATAARLAACAAGKLKQLGASALFKKIDSTLRGPIAAELQAIHEAWPSRTIVFTPAYPRLGRTVSGGRLFVNGLEVSATDFASDCRSPVRDSRVESVLPLGCDEWLRVCDASTDEDLQGIVCGKSADAVYAGSGGLGRVWAEHLVMRESLCLSVPTQPQRVLVISGSHHRSSMRQAEYAQRAGHNVISASEDPGDAVEVQRDLVYQALRHIAADRPDLIIIFGGETAANVLKASDTYVLFPVQELLPGIPVSRARVCDEETFIVTKAGGFGSLYVVDEILRGITP
jgi:uncharacterized protein YgbK (DUF1537 family)